MQYWQLQKTINNQSCVMQFGSFKFVTAFEVGSTYILFQLVQPLLSYSQNHFILIFQGNILSSESFPILSLCLFHGIKIYSTFYMKFYISIIS